MARRPGQHRHAHNQLPARRSSRRALVKGALASGAALAATAVFAPAVRAAKTLKLGYVSPQTGPLAAFAEADNFVISNFLNDGARAASRSATTAIRSRSWSRTASPIPIAPPTSRAS